MMNLFIRWDMVSRRSLSKSLYYLEPDECLPRIRLSSKEDASESLVKFRRSKDRRLELTRQAGDRAVTFLVVPCAGESITYPGFETLHRFKEIVLSTCRSIYSVWAGAGQVIKLQYHKVRLSGQDIAFILCRG